MSHVLIAGPSGSGKNRWALDYADREFGGRFFLLDPVLDTDFKDVVLEKTHQRQPLTLYVVDNADCLTPTQQQFLRRLMETQSDRVRWAFLVFDPYDVLYALRSRCAYVSLAQ